jgi:hypothetical protein
LLAITAEKLQGRRKVTAAALDEGRRAQGSGEGKNAKDLWGKNGPPGLALIAPTEAQRQREKVGAVSAFNALT